MTNYCGSMAEAPWDKERWPHFSPREIACRCCGEIYINVDALDTLQRLRDLLGWPLQIISGHRCERHNLDVGGRPYSVHRQLAFDIALGAYPRESLLASAREVGFKRFGLMTEGLHVDTHPLDTQHAEMWTYGAESRIKWAGLFPPGTPDIGRK